VLSDELRHDVFQGRRQSFTLLGPVTLGWVAHRGHARRFLDDHEVIVEVANLDRLGLPWLGRRPGQQLDRLTLLQSACRIQAQVAADAGAACLDDTTDLVPRVAR
jgi:hypothetical protein